MMSRLLRTREFLRAEASKISGNSQGMSPRDVDTDEGQRSGANDLAHLGGVIGA